MTVLRIFEWLGESYLGMFMQRSSYAFPVVEMVHLLALVVLGGAILLVDLRAFGLGIRTQSAAQLSDELRPFVIAGLSASVASGFLLLVAEPMKCYYNVAFRLKMLFLVMAVVFYFAVQRELFKRAECNKALSRVASVVSLALWLSVALAGRAIGLI